MRVGKKSKKKTVTWQDLWESISKRTRTHTFNSINNITETSRNIYPLRQKQIRDSGTVNLLHKL